MCHVTVDTSKITGDEIVVEVLKEEA